jgi:mono/diheme cytochrome c family protein
MKTFVWITALLVTLAITGAAFVYFGVYNVEATKQDSAPLYHFLHYTMLRSVNARTSDIKVPDLNNAQYVQNGRKLYRQHCVQCHGAPGVSPDPLGFGLRPAPPNLVEAAREWKAADIYWVVKHGLTKTGMPAWEYRLDEQQLWELTAFVKMLPAISPAQYIEWDKTQPSGITNSNSSVKVSQVDHRAGDAKAGRHAVEQYLCFTCHTIPDLTGASSTVGPPLYGIATRKYIAGVLVNTPDNMAKWLHDPQVIVPQSGMPNLHIRERDLQDIVAYLYTLKDVEER